jgi:hypothetical protein
MTHLAMLDHQWRQTPLASAPASSPPLPYRDAPGRLERRERRAMRAVPVPALPVPVLKSLSIINLPPFGHFSPAGAAPV